MTDVGRDEAGYYLNQGGHLWKETRGPDSRCARPGCGLAYIYASGDQCREAPVCGARRGDARCELLLNHEERDHEAFVIWQDGGPGIRARVAGWLRGRGTR